MLRRSLFEAALDEVFRLYPWVAVHLARSYTHSSLDVSIEDCLLIMWTKGTSPRTIQVCDTSFRELKAYRMIYAFRTPLQHPGVLSESM